MKNRLVDRCSVTISSLLLFVVSLNGSNVHAVSAPNIFNNLLFVSDDIRPSTISPISGTYVRSQKLRGNQPLNLDGFGSSVAVSGNTLVVGAMLRDTSVGADRGAVSVYTREGDSWEFKQKIITSASGDDSGASDDKFGFSVDIDGNTIVVGAPEFDVDQVRADRGAAYIYINSGSSWVFQKRILNGDDFQGENTGGEFFGQSVSVDDDYVVVGAPEDKLLDDGFSAKPGSASVYRRDSGSWTRIAKYGGSQLASKFGSSVDVSDGKVIVGSPQHGTSVRGSAFVHTIGGSSIEIPGPTGTGLNFFGRSVAISGSIAVIGAVSGLAKAYVSEFQGGSWTPPADRDLNPNSTFGGSFGYSVAAQGDYVVVGALGSGPGRVHIFRKINSTWTAKAELRQPEVPAQSGDCLGVAVAVSSGIVAGGASCDAVNGTGGAASVWFNTPQQQFDFDSDTFANVSIFRPGNNTWYVRDSGGGFTTKQFGESGDFLAPADYDGDGKTDVAVFRPSNGTWYVQGSTAGYFTNAWGASGDIPLPSDFNSDGKADFVVYRPSNNTWY